MYIKLKRMGLSFRVVLFFLLVLPGCSRSPQYPDEVLKALDFSQGNRGELEKVLKHYQGVEDSLKLRAAFFLIVNMDSLVHVDTASIAPYNKVIDFYDSLVAVKAIQHEPDKKYEIVDKRWKNIVQNYGAVEDKLEVKFDLKSVTAETLISTIEQAFKAWQVNPWSHHVSFDQFCEYILPYNYGTNPIDNWRTIFAQKYGWVKDSLTNKSSSFELCLLMCEHLKWFIYNPQLWERKGFSPYGARYLIKSKAGNCANKVNLNIYAMRSLGIAVTRDYVPYWANRNWGHGWNAFVSDDGRFLDFEGFAERRAWGGRMLNRRNFGNVVDENIREENPVRMSKVFRTTFSQQKQSLILLKGKQNKKSIPLIFHNSRFLDVSDEYFPTSTVALSLYERFDKAEFAYLCTYNNNSWVPVHWGKVVSKKIVNAGLSDTSNKELLINEVRFDKMGRDVVYVAMYYEDPRLSPASPAFVLESNGFVRPLKPSFTKTHTITLFKTHPINPSDSIQAQNYYELFYWDDKWISLGKKKSIGKSLVYQNVPSNALFWLLHLDRTPEEDKERVFTMESGVQKWW